LTLEWWQTVTEAAKKAKAMDELHFGVGKVCTLAKTRLVGDTQADKKSNTDVKRARSISL